MPSKSIELQWEDLPDKLKELIMDSLSSDKIMAVPTHPLFDQAVAIVKSGKFDKIVNSDQSVIVSMADACEAVEGLQQWFIDKELAESGYHMCETLVLFGFLMGQTQTLNGLMEEIVGTLITSAPETKGEKFDLPIAPYQESTPKKFD